MQIDIINTLIHVYHDNQILESEKIEYNIPFMEWIENVITTKDMKFVLEYTNFFQDNLNLKQDFKTISTRIFEKMAKNLDIDKADMAYIECMIDKKQAIVGLKLNYSTNYTHKITENKLTLERLTTTYPAKIKEAFIYYKESKQLFICEKTFDEEGKKVYYLSKYALEIENTSKSHISKIKAIKSTMNKLNKELFEDDLESEIESFDLINNKLLENKQLTVQEIIDAAYVHPTHKEKVLTHLDRKKIKPLEVIKNTEKITEIISKKRFVNEKGIEVKLDSALLNDSEFVEIKKLEDDSYSITIKKVFLK